MKPTHKELAARAMLLGDDWYYDWRDGTFTWSSEREVPIRMLDPITMEPVDDEVASKRRQGRIAGWRSGTETNYERASDYGADNYQWETPIARMDD